MENVTEYDKIFFEYVTCNLCGANDFEVVYKSQREIFDSIDKNEFRSSGDEYLKDPLVKCKRCGLKYVNPRLKASLVYEGYSEAVDETFVSQAEARERTFKKSLEKITKVWKKEPGKILDVGTAGGSFLKVARDVGWVVSGCDPNKWLGQWCKENYGITLTPGTIFDGNYPDNEFDVITLWDVLEHTPNPARNLEECLRILKLDGLLIVNYPDIGAWISRLMGRKWVFLLSVHYYYYTRKTICASLEKSKFKVLKLKPYIQYLELDYILFRASAYIGPVGKILRKVARPLRLSKLKIPYWIGQTLVIAKKNNGDLS